MDRLWSASWIWSGGEESPRNEWRCFRRRFVAPSAEEGAGEAKLHITADSRYVLYVNGAFVGRGPVRSWPKEQFYDTYEIGHLLRPGEPNAIAVLVMHFGLSNFYYLRGRGGLLAEVEAGGAVVCGTGPEWRSSRLGAQRPESPRMSCQQGFAEVYDARGWDERWIDTNFADEGWAAADVVGPAGVPPWTSLRKRDIPFLTEEKLYPERVASLACAKPPTFAAVVDLRAQFSPSSMNHANPIGYAGYLATLVELERDGTVTIGFPGGVRSDRLWVDGRLCTAYEGVAPERYYSVRLAKGEHLIMIDVTTESHHGWGFHFGIDADAPISVRSPLRADATADDEPPVAAVGAFDVIEETPDMPKNAKLRRDHPDYVRAAGMATAAELRTLGEWVRPIGERLVSLHDAFGASVWKTSYERRAVPTPYQNAVLPVPEPAVVAPFDRGDVELVIDFGKERTGFVGFEIDAPEGTIVDLYGVEFWSESYVQHTYELDNTVRYICRSGRQRYESPVRRGFRYLIATIRNASAPVRLHEVYVRQSTYPVANVGAFRCSDALLNDIWDISRHTTLTCMEDTFVDCPAYEQVFWVGDSRNEALVNYYVFGATDIVERCLKLVPGSGDVSPLYLNQVPSGWNSIIPNWTFFWIVACEEFAAHTGRRAFAAELWPAVRRTLDAYSAHVDGDGLLNIRGWNLLDWAPMDQPNEGVVTHQNMFFAKALRKAAELADAAGAPEEGAPYASAADRLEAAIYEKLWDEERRAYIDCVHADGSRSTVFSMQTQVVAYLCGLAEGERRAIVESYLLQPPEAFVQIGSPFMSFFYYEALRQAGQYRRMLDDMRKHYGQMIEHGATTCWEMYPNFAENRANPDMLTRSHCHAWSAAPGYFLGESILGVKRAAPGWTVVDIAPEPSGLTWANGAVPLPGGGVVSVAWAIRDGRMTLKAEAPEGVELRIRFPEGLEGRAETSVVRSI